MEKLENLLDIIFTTAEEEISCEECYLNIDQFVEDELNGRNSAQAMPLVKLHLRQCPECREEYEMLLRCMRELKICA